MQNNNELKQYQHEFIKFSIQKNVLKFGEFTLKSGRISPYFFNAGLFNDGNSLAKLGQFYAQALTSSKINFDLLFGPAYKGIPLASITALCLSSLYQQNALFAYNRKERKSHGEGGHIVGAPLAGNIMIIDDVITAGTAIREVIDLITMAGAKPVGVVIALDRQEKGQGELSAIQEVERDYNIPVISVVNLSQVLDYTKSRASLIEHSQAISNYRAQYGIET